MHGFYILRMYMCYFDMDCVSSDLLGLDVPKPIFYKHEHALDFHNVRVL